MTQTPDALMRSAETMLQAARDAVEAEIRRYPRPISGCDAQFNHLLAQRQMVRRALSALETTPLIPTSRNPAPTRSIDWRR